MKQIKLKRITLTNFKGAKNRVVEFSDSATISGANGTGKSTIYEAYLWCLFNKNAYGNEVKVQPLDANNEPIHNLETSVKLELELDGSALSVERKLKEDWTKPRGSEKMVLKGTSSTYFINGVPKTQTDYNVKLNEIFDIAKWFMLSSINILPNMEQKARRLALQSIAPEFDEKKLAEKYPAVLDALGKGVTADELALTTKNSKAKAKSELDTIPARIDEVEKLRVTDVDFVIESKRADEIEAELKQIDERIESIKHPAEADGFFIQKSKEQQAELTELNGRIAKMEKLAMDEEFQYLKSHKERELEAKSNINRLEYELKNANEEVSHSEVIEKAARESLDKLRDQWIKINSEPMPSFSGTCPTCGQMLPANKIKESEDAWRLEKAKRLKQVEDAAGVIKSDIKKNIEVKNNAASRIDEITKQLDDAKKLADDEKEHAEFKSPVVILHELKDYKDACGRRDELMQLIEDATKELDEQREVVLEPLNANKNKLLAELSERRSKVAQEQTNKRIDAQVAELNKQQSELASVIADCENTEHQVAEFKKRKITMVEENVSSLFEIVHWKMYEPNLTNDGEKEICKAIINGIPYEQQNKAMQVSASIDMINAFSRAYDMLVPLFIDNSESVTSFIQTKIQTILLRVEPNADFNITNN